MNSNVGAARTAETAVELELIQAKLRPIHCHIVRAIDMKLSMLPDYQKLDLGPFLANQQSWQRWKVLRDMKKGMPSGTIEHWSWMPGGSRAGVAAHVIWKVRIRFYVLIDPGV